jgi:hypothetical protein
MSRFKLAVFIALITLAFSVALVGNVMAGEKFKGRTVKHLLKWEQTNVGDEEGHVIVLFEAKGISTDLQGRSYTDGWVEHEEGLFDMNTKTGAGSCQGYSEFAGKDGEKIYIKWKGTPANGTWTFFKGTGKYEGIRGGGTWSPGPPSGDPGYFSSHWEGEAQLPR